MAGCPCGHVPRERCPLCRIPRKCVTSLPSLLRGQRRVAADMFRERALLHYQACCADSGVSPLPYSANGRYCILQHYSADSRDVILSRRESGVSKNLLRLPRSDCNAIMPAFLHTNTIVSPQDPSVALTAVAPLRMTIRAACLKRSLPTACRRCLIPRTGVITFYNTIPRPTAMSF